MILTLDNSRLRQIIPGIIHEVYGETPLFDKILPWIESSKSWLEENFIGQLPPEQHGLYALCEKIIVYRAMADAIPALDVVLSPAGFAVINTEGRAPASNDRVERLIESFRSATDANLVALSAELARIPQWRLSSVGKWWCSSFIYTMAEAYRHRKSEPLFETYRKMRSLALRFERRAAEEFLGQRITETLRQAQHSVSDYDEIISMIREAELAYIACHIDDTQYRWPQPSQIWHMMRPVIHRLKYFPELHQVWKEEMGDIFEAETFKNDIKGAFYF